MDLCWLNGRDNQQPIMDLRCLNERRCICMRITRWMILTVNTTDEKGMKFVIFLDLDISYVDTLTGVVMVFGTSACVLLGMFLKNLKLVLSLSAHTFETTTDSITNRHRHLRMTLLTPGRNSMTRCAFVINDVLFSIFMFTPHLIVIALC